jgi:hopene-associated glycosyltransferase HpnB
LTALVIWVYLLFGRGWFWRMDEEPVEAEPRGATVVAVIPARNEAECVGRAVESLARQKYPGSFRIVVVDDHSDDATAGIARAAAPSQMLDVVSAGELPQGWTGKLWAISEGIRYAERFAPEYLLLTDADIVHPPGNVAELATRAESGGYDLVSYMATLHCCTLSERALIPAFVFFFFMLYPPAWGAGAAGGCMLIRRAALEKIGGIAAIRGELIDDCALAKAVKSHGGRVWLGLNTETLSIREYRSFAEIAHMVSRTAFTQLNHSVLLLLGTIASMAVTYIVPPVLTMRGSIWGAAAWALMSIAYLPALRFYRRSPVWAPALPAVAAFYLAATAQSAVSYWRGAGGVWKGRVQDRRHN